MKGPFTLILPFFLIFTFFLGFPVFAQESPTLYPESASFRKKISQNWLETDILELARLDPFAEIDSFGFTFLVKHSISADKQSIIVSINPFGTDSIRGSWILYRALNDGSPQKIQIFPTNDKNVILEFTPAQGALTKEKTFASIYLYGAKIANKIPLGFPINRLYVLSLEEIKKLTQNSIPWEFFSPNEILYGQVASAVAEIREKLPQLVYLEDGAFDENAYPVFIATEKVQKKEDILSVLDPSKDISQILGGVNCSGFAKWLIDGIIRPIAGSGLKIAPLKTATSAPDTHFTENYRDSRDLFFGLNWVRNLASAVVTAYANTLFTPEVSGVDVNVSPFVGLDGYKKDVGYKVNEIESLLYWLAIKEPGHFYLGAISRERGDPLLRQYHHIAAFFPWFDSKGQFRLAVFESAVETESTVFFNKNSDAWIFLTRLKLPEAGYYFP